MTAPDPGGSARSALTLAGVLAAAGVAHFATPKVFDPLIPRHLGPPRPWVLGSGVAEVACAAGLIHPRTRPLAARAAAALFVGVFPGNLQMAASALASPKASSAYKAVTLARLPLQLPLVVWALRIARG